MDNNGYKTNRRYIIKKLKNSYLWIPDILRLSGYFENATNKTEDENVDNIKPNCKGNKNSCQLSKVKFVTGTGRYVYWNYKPKMIIDLDWIELNSKYPINVILTGKKKK